MRNGTLFENKDGESRRAYPANFIAEGWIKRAVGVTLHAILSMVFQGLQKRIPNGLVLDKNTKMSKRLGMLTRLIPWNNMVDVLRWYMLTNTSPWDNQDLMEGLEEVRRNLWNLTQYLRLLCIVCQ